MSDIFESIKQSAGQVLSNLDQKGQLRSAFDGLRTQWNELERRRKTSSLEKEVGAQQAEMRQLTEALGLQTWSLFDSGKVVHPELARLCERISELRAEIDAKKAELEALKAQQEAERQLAAQLAAAQRAAAQGTAAQGTAAQGTAAQGTAAQGGMAQSAAPQAAAAPPSSQVRTVVRLRCPRCKTELRPGDDFCPSCGVKLVHPAPAAQQTAAQQTAAQQTAAQYAAPQPRPAAQVPPPPQPARSQPDRQPVAASVHFCPSCGAETKPTAQFCPICGQALH